MSFQVDPAALRTFAGHLDSNGQDAEQATRYLHRYTDLSWHGEGLMNRLQPAHEAFVTGLARDLAHLKELLEKSKAELDKAADYYTETDTTSAARLDATYPPTSRPSRPPDF